MAMKGIWPCAFHSRQHSLVTAHSFCYSVRSFVFVPTATLWFMLPMDAAHIFHVGCLPHIMTAFISLYVLFWIIAATRPQYILLTVIFCRNDYVFDCLRAHFLDCCIDCPEPVKPLFCRTSLPFDYE